MSSTEKPIVFLSFAHQDTEVVRAIKDKLVEITAGEVTFFMAGDEESIPAGVNWRKLIEERLTSAAVVLVFLSYSARASQWVLFEAGFAYAKGIPAVPIGILGAHVDEEKPPLASLQGFDIYSENGLNQIVVRLNQHLGRHFPEAFSIFDHASIFGSRPFQIRPPMVQPLLFRPQIYDEVKRQVADCPLTSKICATATLFDPDDQTDEHFSSYLELLARRCAEAEQAKARLNYHVVLGISRVGNKIPAEQRITILQRIKVFREAGALSRLKLFELPEHWSLNILFVGREHAIIGFPEDRSNPQLQHGFRVSGSEFVGPMLDWYKECVEGRAVPLPVDDAALSE